MAKSIEEFRENASSRRNLYISTIRDLLNEIESDTKFPSSILEWNCLSQIREIAKEQMEEVR